MKTHVGRLLAKLDQRDRVQLVVFAYETRLVAPVAESASGRTRLATRGGWKRASARTDLRRHDRARHRPARLAFAWTAVFIAWHGYWALGGDFGFGDQESGFPDAGWAVHGRGRRRCSRPASRSRSPSIRDLGPRRLLAGLLWAEPAVLSARGSRGSPTTRSASAGLPRPA